MDVSPGVLHDGGADTGAPIAVVSTSGQRVADYLAAAPIGQYVVVRLVEHIPTGMQLGGVAMLDREPVSDELAAALVTACLKGLPPRRGSGGHAAPAS